MSVENLLKAIMVRDEPCLVGKYKISDEIKSHNVWSEYGDTSKRDKPVKFLNGSEVATGGRLQSVISEDGTEQSIKDVLEEDEQEFLRIVEAYVAWIGRFPSATKERDFMSDLDVVKNSKLAKLSLDDFDSIFNTIYLKLSALAGGVNLQKAGLIK